MAVRIRPRTWALLLVCGLSLLLIVSPAVLAQQAADQDSACEQVTPPDAPYACLEVIPPGPSAWVSFDGVTWGLSPMGIPEVAPGQHTLRLDREGEVPWVTSFSLAEGEVRRFDPVLTRLPLRIAPPGPEEAWPLAVMVENNPDARPQVGLDQADVVYDALAEGGISRFLAVYITRDADTIGPVRSTRHYFAYIAAEYNATLVHVGASPIGYAALSATGIRNVNESMGDPGVWRSYTRVIPHNAFTSTVGARAAADGKDIGGGGSWGPMVFKDPSARTEVAPATSLSIRYPPWGWYSVGYEYDAENNRYLRWMDGYPHREPSTGEQLGAANVVVQVVPDEVIDREGRLELEQTGEGRAYFFLDGGVLEGYWTKADFGSRTLFWDTAGNRVRLNAGGTTWIQLVPPEAVVEFR